MRYLLGFILCFLALNSSAQRNFDPCLLNKGHKIVVLGSSTAAGSGPSSRDSAWVWKFRRHLQNLNPAITVTNLAVGGFVSYRIMPHEFKAPIGRPTPDSTHNITQALSLNPDVIVVNLPSNDRQYPIAEQLSNFDSLFRMSNRAGVPMYICTTQPIANSGPYQAEVKDSIYSMFGNFVIDFWSTFADSTNLCKPIYLADAVHYNNLGHRILTDRVIDKNVLQSLRDTNPGVDYGLQKVNFTSNSPCADSFARISYNYYNSGKYSGKQAFVNLDVFENDKLTIRISDSIKLLNPCSVDSGVLSARVANNAKYKFRISLSHPDDTSLVNNSDSVEMELFSLLELTTDQDTLWSSGRIRFCAYSDSGSVVSWYNDSLKLNKVDSNICTFTPYHLDTMFFVEVCKKHIANHLEEIKGNSEVRWNGVMLDVIANDNIQLKSINPLTPEVDSQTVNIYFKAGSHKTNTLDSSSWHLYKSITSIADTNGIIPLNIKDTSIQAGDTLGIYIEFDDMSSRLYYDRLSGGDLLIDKRSHGILLGTGVSHNFSAMFSPRKFLGEIEISSTTICCSDLKKMVYKYPLGNSIDDKLNIVVYPNPATHRLFIQTEGTPIMDIKLFDINGQHIHHIGTGTNSRIEIETKSLPAGTYLLNLHLANQVIREKILIIK